MSSADQRINFRALASFRYEIRRYLNISEKAARTAGIEPQQHQALLAIKGLPQEWKPTIGVLAERLQIEHNTAVELCLRLERNGLVRRARNGLDRREVLLALTTHGENLLRELSLNLRRELRKAGPKLIEALDAAMVLGGVSRRARQRTGSRPRVAKQRSRTTPRARR